MSTNKAKADCSDASEHSLAFRGALGNFLTGVTVVTTIDGHGRPRGITANSFSSVSLDPPLVLVCIARSAESFDAFVNGRGFAVNILADHQRSVSQIFASKSPEKFRAVRWTLGDNGAPILDDCLAWFDCRRHRRIEAGDHAILIGEVTRFEAGIGRPLGYCRGNYVNFGLMEDAMAQSAGGRVSFGCVIHDRHQLLLCRAGAGSRWSLPLGSLREHSTGGRKALLDLLADAGIEAELGFLYSVFDVPETGETQIIYRGELRSPSPLQAVRGVEFRRVPFARIPWSDLASPQLAAMLERYVREQATDSFGIYADGVGEEGYVARLSGAPEPWRPG